MNNSRGVVITRQQLADILGIGVNTISRNHKEGLYDKCIATTEEAEQFLNLKATNTKHFYWSLDAVKTYFTANPITKDNEVQLDASTRKLEAEAVLAEVKASIAIEEVASLEDIIRITGGSLAVFREEMLSLSIKISPLLLAAETPMEMRVVIDKEVERILERLSDRFGDLREEMNAEVDDANN